MNYKGFLKKRRLYFILLISVFLLFIASITSAQILTQVELLPSTQTVTGSAEINLNIIPSTPIAGAQFDVSFDPNMLQVSEVKEGNLLSQNGANTFFQQGTIDNVLGTIKDITAVITESGQSVSSEGNLASIVFLVKQNAQGSTNVQASNVVVGDINGNSLQLDVKNSGIAEINIDSKPKSFNSVLPVIILIALIIIVFVLINQGRKKRKDIRTNKIIGIP